MFLTDRLTLSIFTLRMRSSCTCLSDVSTLQPPWLENVDLTVLALLLLVSHPPLWQRQSLSWPWSSDRWPRRPWRTGVSRKMAESRACTRVQNRSTSLEPYTITGRHTEERAEDASSKFIQREKKQTQPRRSNHKLELWIIVTKLWHPLHTVTIYLAQALILSVCKIQEHWFQEGLAHLALATYYYMFIQHEPLCHKPIFKGLRVIVEIHPFHCRKTVVIKSTVQK